MLNARAESTRYSLMGLVELVKRRGKDDFRAAFQKEGYSGLRGCFEGFDLIPGKTLLFITEPLFEYLQHVSPLAEKAQERKYFHGHKGSCENKIADLPPVREHHQHRQEKDKRENGDDRGALHVNRRNRVKALDLSEVAAGFVGFRHL